MNVLAFDTSLGACSAAVLLTSSRRVGGRTDGCTGRLEVMATGQAERLVPMIDDVVREAGCAFTDLDTIAVTEGPGTFTGLRVGIAAARGFSLALGIPIRATTSLHIMAKMALAEWRGELAGETAIVICPRGPAGQVFAQAFSISGDPLTSAALVSIEEAARLAPGHALACAGSGAVDVQNAASRLGRRATSGLPALQPDARVLAVMAPNLPVRRPLVPLYLRAPDAKPQVGKSVPRI